MIRQWTRIKPVKQSVRVHVKIGKRKRGGQINLPAGISVTSLPIPTKKSIESHLSVLQNVVSENQSLFVEIAKKNLEKQRK